jgi:hypothetical protein
MKRNFLLALGIVLLISCGTGPQAIGKMEDERMNMRNPVLTLIEGQLFQPVSVLAGEANIIPQPAPPKQLPRVPPIMTPQNPMQKSPIQPAIIPQPRPTLVRPQRDAVIEPEKSLPRETEPVVRNETPPPKVGSDPQSSAVLAAMTEPSVSAKPRPIPQPEASPPFPVLESIAEVTLKSAQPASPPKIEIKPEPVPPPKAEPEIVFDPQSITQETFDSTKAEVEAVIKTLNSINQRGDYQAWLKYLDNSYREKLSSPEFLETQSKQPRLTSQRIVLSSLRDYFTHVFIPARKNARVDTIEFDDHKKVKVIAINRRRIRPPSDPKELERIQPNIVEKTRDGWLILNERVLYYELEKTDNGWKIIDFIN